MRGGVGITLGGKTYEKEPQVDEEYGDEGEAGYTCSKLGPSLGEIQCDDAGGWIEAARRVGSV